MNHLNHYFLSLKTAIIVATCLISQQTLAQTAPAEAASAQIKRSATTPQTAVVTLTKNLFKLENYDAPYIVQVPYQTTESYTVEVPYQTTESYTVEVPYQVDETYTEQVPYEH